MATIHRSGNVSHLGFHFLCVKVSGVRRDQATKIKRADPISAEGGK